MFTRNNRSKNKQTLFLTTILLLLSLPGFCQVTWLTSNGTSWLTGRNWTGGVIPTATDVAQFNRCHQKRPCTVVVACQRKV